MSNCCFNINQFSLNKISASHSNPFLNESLLYPQENNVFPYSEVYYFLNLHKRPDIAKVLSVWSVILSCVHRGVHKWIPLDLELTFVTYLEQNHRATEIGRGPRKSFSLNSPLKAGPATAGCALGFAYPEARGLHTLSGQPAPLFDHPHSERDLQM